MVEVGKIGDKTLVLDGRYISIFRGGKLVWKKIYRAYPLPDGNLYLYRRRVRITELSGNTLTDYQIKIEIGAGDPIFAHARSAGEDIRFCYYPEEEMLSYWIEKFDPDAEEAIIWVKVPSIPANSEIEIYMYYGNPTVASGSDASATFIRVIDGLVGAWHFDEGSGDVAYDSSGQGNDGTIYGAKWVDGKFKKALEFDGSDDYVLANLPHSNSISVVAWIYDYRNVTGNRGIFVAQPITGDPAGDQKIVGLWLKDTGELWGRLIQSDGTLIDFPLQGNLASNTWYHVVLTADSPSGVGKLWVNGSELSSVSYDGTLKDFSYAKIGRQGTETWDGILDEVLVLNKALTAEEISDLYNNYGYATTNYPGKVLVRKYTEPEPSVSVGAEE